MSDHKRPLVLKIDDVCDEGGNTDAEALAKGLLAGDGFLVLRYAATEETMHISASSLGGSLDAGAASPLGAGALFDGWLAFTAYAAARAKEEGDERKQKFLSYVLKLHGLDENLDLIQNASGANLVSLRTAAENPAPSAPAAQLPQAGEGPASTG